MRKIATAYDAYWFLYEHPKMRCREAVLLSNEDAKNVSLSRDERLRGQRLRKVKDEMPWNDGKYVLREFRLYRQAIDCNLDIHYALVDDRGMVNEDHSRNKVPRCWLEFGPVKQAVSDGVLHVQHSHDIRLDCGGWTFDDALVKLANLVMKHYGDFGKGSKSNCSSPDIRLTTHSDCIFQKNTISDGFGKLFWCHITAEAQRT